MNNNYTKFNLVDSKDAGAFIKQLKQIEWVYWLNRPYSIFMATVYWEGVRDVIFKRTGFSGLGTNNHLYQFPDLYYDRKFHDQGVVYWNEYFQKHKVSHLSDQYEKMHSHHLEELKKLVINGEAPIERRLEIMSDLIQDYVPYLWIISHLEEHFNKIIAREVPKYIDGDYSKFVGDISLPVKKNVYVLMLEDIKSGMSTKDVQNKYGWMKSRDGFTDFYTEKEIEEIKNGIKETEKHVVDIPKELIWLADELKELNFFRTSRTDKFYEYFGVARPFMEEVAQHIGVSFKELADYDVNSIILGKPRKYSANFSYGLINNDYLLSDNKLIDFDENENQEIKGRTAFKGIVRGIAKIVTHPNDIDKVQAGDVLVAQMTFPSFISAMQKSIAFVTDEGSIACHAAIVAREMKKPCIVGTKNATKVLKDGDMVEVDADKGIVKIIK